MGRRFDEVDGMTAQSKWTKLRRLRSRLGNMANFDYQKIEDRATSKLKKAITKFIEEMGGEPEKIGRAEIWSWPTSESCVFRIAMKITGTPPPFVGRREGIE